MCVCPSRRHDFLLEIFVLLKYLKSNCLERTHIKALYALQGYNIDTNK